MALSSRYLRSNSLLNAFTWSRLCYTRRLLSGGQHGDSKDEGPKKESLTSHDAHKEEPSSAETSSKDVQAATHDGQILDSASKETGMTGSSEESAGKPKPGRFAKAFEKFTSAEFLTEQLEEEEKAKEAPRKIDERDTWSFPKLLRHSKLMQLGDPEGRIVEGKIFHIVNDDLYIDFGAKLHCVCQRPRVNGELYVRGSKVRLRINKLEMSKLFLGAAKELTLLESDATLLGLIQSPVKKVQAAASSKQAT